MENLPTAGVVSAPADVYSDIDPDNYEFESQGDIIIDNVVKLRKTYEVDDDQHIAVQYIAGV